MGKFSIGILIFHSPISSMIRIVLLKMGIFHIYIHIILGVVLSWYLAILLTILVRKIKYIDIIFIPQNILSFNFLIFQESLKHKKTAILEFKQILQFLLYFPFENRLKRCIQICCEHPMNVFNISHRLLKFNNILESSFEFFIAQHLNSFLKVDST